MPVFLSISLSNLITRKTCSIFSVLIVQTCHMICHHTGTNALTTYQPSRISWFSFLKTLNTSAGTRRSDVCHYLAPKTHPHCSIPRRFISQSCGWLGCATHVLSTHRSVTPNHPSLSWHSPQPTSPVKLMSTTPSAASDPFQWSRDPSSSRINSISNICNDKAWHITISSLTSGVSEKSCHEHLHFSDPKIFSGAMGNRSNLDAFWRVSLNRPSWNIL